MYKPVLELVSVVSIGMLAGGAWVACVSDNYTEHDLNEATDYAFEIGYEYGKLEAESNSTCHKGILGREPEYDTYGM